jgi:hypothetical protein
LNHYVKIKKPARIQVLFLRPVYGFTILTYDGKIFYERKEKDKSQSWSVNINRAGNFIITCSEPVSKIIYSEIPKFNTWPLPKENWNHSDKKCSYVITTKFNSPASIVPSTAITYIHPKIFSYPIYVQEFVKAHEKGHLFYASEVHCDIFAINYIMKHGGNLTTCRRALDILSKTANNTARIKAVEKYMMDNYKRK